MVWLFASIVLRRRVYLHAQEDCDPVRFLPVRGCHRGPVSQGMVSDVPTHRNGEVLSWDMVPSLMMYHRSPAIGPTPVATPVKFIASLSNTTETW